MMKMSKTLAAALVAGAAMLPLQNADAFFGGGPFWGGGYGWGGYGWGGGPWGWGGYPGLYGMGYPAYTAPVVVTTPQAAKK